MLARVLRIDFQPKMANREAVTIWMETPTTIEVPQEVLTEMRDQEFSVGSTEKLSRVMKQALPYSTR